MKTGYLSTVYFTQAQVDVGAGDAVDSARIIIVDGAGDPTGIIYESGPAGSPPVDVGGANHNLAATTAPGVNDDSNAGYSVGSRWIDITADESYICVDASVGTAVWSSTTVGTIAEVSGLQTALDGKAASRYRVCDRLNCPT